jgi:hypothetical protein
MFSAKDPNIVGIFFWHSGALPNFEARKERQQAGNKVRNMERMRAPVTAHEQRNTIPYDSLHLLKHFLYLDGEKFGCLPP